MIGDSRTFGGSLLELTGERFSISPPALEQLKYLAICTNNLGRKNQLLF
jgi:hypothetical protein